MGTRRVKTADVRSLGPKDSISFAYSLNKSDLAK